MKSKLLALSVLASALSFSGISSAESVKEPAEAAKIRATIESNLKTFPKIEAVRKTEVDGIYEVQYGGAELIYANKDGSYLFQGSMIDTKKSKNLTQDRVAKLTAIDFKTLPFKDSITIVKGDGKRKMAIFEDPNCGFCKRFEADLKNVDNVTMHVFLYPVLGPDSQKKSKDIWCTPDKSKAWHDWMVNGVVPPSAPENCDTSAIDRTVAFGQANKITGTPTSYFVSGVRTPGAIPAAEVEKILSSN